VRGAYADVSAEGQSLVGKIVAGIIIAEFGDDGDRERRLLIDFLASRRVESSRLSAAKSDFVNVRNLVMRRGIAKR